MSRTFHNNTICCAVIRSSQRPTQWEMFAVCLHLRVLFIRETCVLSSIQPLFSIKCVRVCVCACAIEEERILNRNFFLLHLHIVCHSLSLPSAFRSLSTTSPPPSSYSSDSLAIRSHSVRCMQFLICTSTYCYFPQMIMRLQHDISYTQKMSAQKTITCMRV